MKPPENWLTNLMPWLASRARPLKSTQSIESINYQEALYRLFHMNCKLNYHIKILVGKAGVQLCAFRMCSNSRQALIYEKLRLRNMEENTNIFHTCSNVFQRRNMEVWINSSWLILIRNFTLVILHWLSIGLLASLINLVSYTTSLSRKKLHSL